MLVCFARLFSNRSIHLVREPGRLTYELQAGKTNGTAAAESREKTRGDEMKLYDGRRRQVKRRMGEGVPEMTVAHTCSFRVHFRTCHLPLCRPSRPTTGLESALDCLLLGAWVISIASLCDRPGFIIYSVHPVTSSTVVEYSREGPSVPVQFSLLQCRSIDVLKINNRVNET